MKTLSILTLATALTLLSLGWVGFRPAQAQDKAQEQEPAASPPPAAAVESTGTPESDSPSPEGAEADKLLAEARSRLEDRQSLQADLVQKITVGERVLEAEGKYIAGSPFPKLRLEYRLRAGTMQGSLIEVCDGQILHTEKAIGRVGAKTPDRQFTRRDVQRILAARDNAQNLPVASLGAELGIGGLPALLASIDRCMVGKKITEEEFDGQPCRVFHGTWDPSILKIYDQGLAESKAKLVPFFPDSVQVSLTSDTHLPLKIVYLKNELNETGKVIGVKPLMSLEFRNVVIDAPLPPETFVFTLPPKSEEIDETNKFLDLVKQADASFQQTPPKAKKP